MSNPTLRASLGRIEGASALWRREVDLARETGRRVVVVTSDQVVVADRPDGTTQPFDSALLAEVTPVSAGEAGVDAVLVVVNLALLNDLHNRLGSAWSERDADLDRILIHEVYGHALPYVLAGDLSGQCADPVRGQRTTDACSIQRENAVRAELGLGRRTDYGIGGLALARHRQR